MFIADLRRMLNNCFRFNAPQTLYYKAGCDLAKIANRLTKNAFPKSDIFPEAPEFLPI